MRCRRVSVSGSCDSDVVRLIRIDISIRTYRYIISLNRSWLGLVDLPIRFSVRESVRIRPSDRPYNLCGLSINNPETLDGLGLGFVTFYDNLNIFIFSCRYIFSVCDPRGSDRWIDLKFIVGYSRIYPET